MLIQWVLFEIAQDPELQQRLRNEVSTPGDPSFDELNNKFPLLDAVFKEVVRLHPPILENHHQACILTITLHTASDLIM
jgi:cytochrome P450